MKYIIIVALLLGVAWYFTRCSKDQKAADEAIIQQYIIDHNLTAIEAEDGLYYTEDVIGTGVSPNINNRITLHYKGYFTDGRQFDATTTNPVTFPLSNLIKGWQYGLQHFKKGGKGKLLVPSHLGYGTNPPAGIPPNAVLIFDIDLIDVM